MGILSWFRGGYCNTAAGRHSHGTIVRSGPSGVGVTMFWAPKPGRRELIRTAICTIFAAMAVASILVFQRSTAVMGSLHSGSWGWINSATNSIFTIDRVMGGLLVLFILLAATTPFTFGGWPKVAADGDGLTFFRNGKTAVLLWDEIMSICLRRGFVLVTPSVGEAIKVDTTGYAEEDRSMFVLVTCERARLTRLRRGFAHLTHEKAS